MLTILIQITFVTLFSAGMANILEIEQEKMIPLSFFTICSVLYFFGLFNMNPVDFNEKIMWLKLKSYYNNELVTQCADKLRLRNYVKEKLGNERNLPILYDSWSSVDEINWENLPDRFVIKCNHGCGYNIICKDKRKLSKAETIAQLTEWMREDYYKLHVETVYKFIPKRILCEEYLEDNSGREFLTDYKFYCFSGIPKVVLVCEERTEIGRYIKLKDVRG